MARTKFTAKEVLPEQPVRSKRTKQPVNKPRRTKAPAMYPPCQSCRIWKGSIISYYDDKNPLGNKRNCRAVKHEIGPIDKGCVNYVPSIIFYCYIKSVFMYAEACAHRNKKELCEECGVCKHGKALGIYLHNHPASVDR